MEAVEASKPTLTWGLAIATYNRHAELLRCVEAALAQTLPPVEIVIADSTVEGCDAFEAELRRLISGRLPAVRFVYVRSKVARTTVQRNLAVASSTADILFMIDDDTLMHPRCAEVIVSVYEADHDREIAAIGASEAGQWPIDDRRASEAVGTGGRERGHGPLNLLLPERQRHGAPLKSFSLANVALESVRMITGAYMTVRRSIAVQEPFDPAFVINMFEEADGTKRFLQHGALVIVLLPLMHHLQGVRPRKQGRRGRVDRFAFCLNHAYLSRKLIRSKLKAFIYATGMHIYFFGIDVVRLVVQRRGAPLVGVVLATPKVMRLLLLRQSELADYVIECSTELQAKARAASV